jgi:RHS repeat-associated protein
VVSAARYYSGSGLLATRTTGGGLTYVGTDAQGTLTATLMTGGVSTLQRYKPFGEQRGGLNQLPSERGFIGQVEDTATGLSYLNARHYDAKNATFLGVDPVLRLYSPESLNAYIYAGNNPVRFADPTGREKGANGEPCQAKGNCASAPNPMMESKPFPKVPSPGEAGFTGPVMPELRLADGTSASEIGADWYSLGSSGGGLAGAVVIDLRNVFNDGQLHEEFEFSVKMVSFFNVLPGRVERIPFQTEFCAISGCSWEWSESFTLVPGLTNRENLPNGFPTFLVQAVRIGETVDSFGDLSDSLDALRGSATSGAKTGKTKSAIGLVDPSHASDVALVPMFQVELMIRRKTPPANSVVVYCSNPSDC